MMTYTLKSLELGGVAMIKLKHAPVVPFKVQSSKE